MAFKSIPRLLGKIIITLALANTLFDCYSFFYIYQSGPLDSQLVDSSRITINLISHSVDPHVKNDRPKSEFSDTDYTIMTSDDMASVRDSHGKITPTFSTKELETTTIFDVQLHKEFWKAYRENSTQDKDKNNYKTFNEAYFLDKFKNVSLWPLIKSSSQSINNTNKSVETIRNESDSFGFGSQYESRFLTQYLWAVKAQQLNPNIFNKKKPKKIMIKDTFKWWNYNGDRELSCPGSAFDKRCTVHEKRIPFEKFDAHIFVRDAFHTGRHSVNKNSSSFYFILESPHFAPYVNLLRPKDYLCSYWRGSDIQTAYGKWAYYNPAIRKMKQTTNYAAGKTKMAAIFVSNCEAINKRLDYVKELAQHVEVDIYGHCGKLQCSHNKQESCFNKLKTEYRFYLAFENSNCRDYITEKFFVNALANDVIPIVMGAHPEDYKSAAPQNSYIHVEDFESPKYLAAYMRYLAQNEDKYKAYFEWKGTGDFVGMPFFCRVCALLYYADEHPRGARNLQEKWKYIWSTQDELKNPMCLPGGRFYWNRVVKPPLITDSL